jgi:hypothetical protein
MPRRPTLTIVNFSDPSRVHVRALILIAMPAIVRKLILDLASVEPRGCLPWPPTSWRWLECT